MDEERTIEGGFHLVIEMLLVSSPTNGSSLEAWGKFPSRNRGTFGFKSSRLLPIIVMMLASFNLVIEVLLVSSLILAIESAEDVVKVSIS